MTNEQINRIWLIMAEVNRQNRFINQRLKYSSCTDKNRKQLLRRHLECLAKTEEEKKFLKDNPI